MDTDSFRERFRNSPAFPISVRTGIAIHSKSCPEQAPNLLLSLDSTLYTEELRDKVSVTRLSQLPATQRARDRASHWFNELSFNILDQVADSMRNTFKSQSSNNASELFHSTLAMADPAKVKWLPILPVSTPLFAPEPAVTVDTDVVPNGFHTKLTPTTSKTTSERAKSTTIPSISLLTPPESSLSKKKSRVTNYGKLKSDDADTIDLDAPQPVEGGFITARQKFDEDAARNGRPLLPRENKDAENDKKRKRTVEELAGWTGDDEEPDVSSAPKRRTPIASVTSSIVSKSSKPLHPTPNSNTGLPTSKNPVSTSNGKNSTSKSSSVSVEDESEKEVFKGIDPEIAERVLNEILDTNMNVKWTDIAGLEDVKQTLREMIILPNLHPEMFTGLRAPPRGLLLFGPPGNGKTMIAKAIATEAGLTFFSISASVLCSKWIGEGEKTMRALFTIARAKAPSFIFIDEVDSILCSRSSEEHESSRRLKNEFLTQFDGATSSPEDAVTIMGATNRPFDLDDAARRRMPKRIYVPLPEPATRYNLLSHLLKGENHCLSEDEVHAVANKLEGYSCSDIHQLSQQAAMGPVRDKMRSGMMTGALRAIEVDDFDKAVETNRPSVAPEECKLYEDFSAKFGTKGL